MITYDDQSKPEEASTMVTKLITQDNVTAVIGEVAEDDLAVGCGSGGLLLGRFLLGAAHDREGREAEAESDLRIGTLVHGSLLLIHMFCLKRKILSN
ncbi:MAG: hypothetical protein ACXWSC_05725 [Bdellovibrionota bacterium]